ncbi:nitrogenase cofactor biosynthesis protein NifB [Chloroflexota bacterium]
MSGKPCVNEFGVGGKEIRWDPEHLRKIKNHPCFSKEAQHILGRMHLSVAPRCNVSCNYCIRRYDCANESRPGVTSEVLTSSQAIDRVREVVAEFSNIKVVGIAGPGEPLYNEETFQTLQLVKQEFPHLQLCLSTNGLLLPEKLSLLHELGVATLTVTMSAVDTRIGEKIYSWVRYNGKYLRGQKAAELLLANQLAGIKGAIERGIVVKVNSVMIPSINDQHLIEVAKKCRQLGVYMHNIMPLIPQAKFSDMRPPTSAERKEVQDACSVVIKQMRHCRQCRADAIGLIGRDVSQTSFPPKT